MKALRDTLEARLEMALRRESLTPEKLEKALGASAEEVQGALLVLKEHISNVGFPDSPILMWKPGDLPIPELIPFVKRLLAEHAMGTHELAKAMGAKFPKVHRVINILRSQEPKDRFLNLGTPLVPKWFFIPEKCA